MNIEGGSLLTRWIAIAFVSSALLAAARCLACIWDSDTLADEKRKSPDLAALILGTKHNAPDTNALQQRVVSLKAKPRESDPTWWNELAGAYLRLGHPQDAVHILEPLLIRFPDDYGVHANLGTAYHLLGRYQEAEREIARDLQLNPNAHFGIEVYHLALLQYLSRDQAYQSRHVYVDEFTRVFLDTKRFFALIPEHGLANTNTVSYPGEIKQLNQELATLPQDDPSRESVLSQLASLDPPPGYRSKWNLATHPNFQKGIFYMAELNAGQPACFVMLGIAALKHQDLNLAVAAFARAIKLGSPQSKLLSEKNARIQDHIREAAKYRRPWTSIPAIMVLLAGIALLVFIRHRIRRKRRHQDSYPH